jgi:HK97 family phage major capsid protein
MTKEQYLNQRSILVDEAQALLNEGKLDEANTKQDDIKQLDEKYENIAKANANLAALAGNPAIKDVTKLGLGNLAGRVADSITPAVTDDDIYNTADYKKSFMNYVMKGSKIPAQLKNADANTKTTDVGEMIPTTTLEKIIEKMEATGMILPLVTKTSYKGGLEIPTSTVKPVATWVAEGAGSDKQKKTTGAITFAYHKLRCAVSWSLEVDVMSYSVFETTFVNNVVESMVKAKEQAIISGTGTGQPKGILTETVVAGQNIEIAAVADVTYATLVSAESALPLAYEADAVWSMTKKTFMKFIGMVDDAGQPIARVNYGIAGKPERTLLGRQVVLNDYMTSLGATITSDTVVAFLFNFKDYVLNSNLNLTVKRYEDNDTDDTVTKAIELVDGKVVDKNSLVTITKKSA